MTDVYQLILKPSITNITIPLPHDDIAKVDDSNRSSYPFFLCSDTIIHDSNAENNKDVDKPPNNNSSYY
jgi:hypothetical protein